MTLAKTKTTRVTSKPLEKGGATRRSAPRTALERLRKRLEAIADEALRQPSIPVDKLVAEAAALAKVARRHESVLVRVGLDAKLIAELPSRTDALTDAQAALTLARTRQRSAEEVWCEEEATALRSDMVADARWALRDDGEVQAALSTIQEGEGIDDLLQDLRELEQLFTRHTTALRRVGAEPRTKAQKARALTRRLQSLLADRRGGLQADGAERKLRDRAAVFLEDAMREVRAAGVYAFRKDPAKQALFRSAYRSRRPRPVGEPEGPNGEGSAPGNGGAG